MKIEHVEKEALSFQNKRRKKKNLQKILEEFWTSDSEVIRVKFEDFEYKHAKSAQASFINSIKAGNYRMYAVIRKEVLYIIKE